MRPRLALPALLSLVVAGVVACSRGDAPAQTGERRGLWVLAEGSERTLDSSAKIDALVDRAAALGVTDLFVQVHRAGRSWFPSENADDSPYREIRAREPGAPEPLVHLLEQAHAQKLKVHAWFNCLNAATNREHPAVVKLGRDAVQVDRAGRNLLDFPNLDLPAPENAQRVLETPGLWLDPATPGVIEQLEAVVDDLARAAPELDGLHFDFVRYPFTLPIPPGSRFATTLDFGYGEPAKKRFKAEHGSFETGDEWDEFRRQRVTELVTRLASRAPTEWETSAAVLSYADRAYLASFQDWRRWLDEDKLDFAVAMTYTRDEQILRYQAQSLRFGVGGARVWLGLGAWLVADSPAALARQLAIARAATPPGIVLFSWDSLVEKRETLAVFAAP